MTDEFVPDGILPRRETSQAEGLLNSMSYMRGYETKRAHDLIEPYLLAFEASVVPLVEASRGHWAAVDAQPITMPDGTVLVPGRRYDIASLPPGWRGDKTQTLRNRELLRVEPQRPYQSGRVAVFSSSSRRGKKIVVTGPHVKAVIREVGQ